MTDVWVVEWHMRYEGGEVFGVFATREAAQAYAEAQFSAEMEGDAPGAPKTFLWRHADARIRGNSEERYVLDINDMTSFHMSRWKVAA